MKHLQEIARRVRRPEEQLRFPSELLLQGYEPNYLANYRPDELGNMDERTLSTLKRTLQQFDKLEAHRSKVIAALEKDAIWSETIAEVVNKANSIAEIDTTVRHIRARKNAKSIAEKSPAAQVVGQAILTMQSEAPTDFKAWVAQTASVSVEQADEILEQTKLWMTHLLSEDLRLMRELQQYVLRKGTASVKVLPEPPKGSDAEKRLDASEDQASVPVDAMSTGSSVIEAASDAPAPETASDASSSEPHASADASETSANEASQSSVELEASVDPSVAPLIAEFNQGKKPSKPIKTKSLSEKQLSPRQRRRRWLRGILESYARLKKPVGNITPYQILMLARGLRSQIIQLNIDYDKKPLVQMCREALCPGRHPMHGFLLEVAESALHTFLLPRVHQDVMAILEEYANEELTESAVSHLQSSLLQRPIRGHRILMIDAVGPKMAAAAIVDAEGQIVFTGELPCNSNRADIVAQNVVTLGQWVHEHRVTLISLSNGPARRYLIQPIAELLKQSSEGSVYWTMVDRAGADGYCNSRICLVELPNISRRHRAAVWLARRLQDPLQQVLKVDPSRLRLGSYQRELPQADLELALRDAVSSAISRSGLDVFTTEPEVLQRAPGMNLAAAKAVSAACREDRITSRETLLAVLKEHLTDMQARQAIGFLRVYGSEKTLDATTIHPDDYRLAERLIEHAKLPVPPAAPEGWVKPNFQAIAEASAAADEAFAKQQAEFGASLDAEHESFGLESSSESDEASEEAASKFGENIGDENVESQNLTDSTPVEPESTSENEPSTSSSASEETGSPESSPATDSSEPSNTGEETNTTSSTETAPAASTHAVAMPPIETAPRVRETLSIDVERLARSWQVGREKMRRVSHCLQSPFEDDREYAFPVPLVSKFPRLDTLKPGDMVQALVVGVTDFGVFVDLGPDCSGLIHISRITPNYVEDPHQYVQMGDLLTVWVLSIDEKRKRVALTAIPPGTPSRREQSAPQGRAEDSRGDRRGAPARGDNRGRGDANRGDAPRSEGAGGNRGERPAGERSGGDRGGNRNDRGNRGAPRGGNDRSRNDRGRGRDRDYEQNAAPRRAQRVDPPKPITPITDAMQQGKEPLRSFSDLMQFMKKSKPDSEIVPEQKGTDPVTPASPAADSAPTPNPSSNESTESSDTPNGPVA